MQHHRLKWRLRSPCVRGRIPGVGAQAKVYPCYSELRLIGSKFFANNAPKRFFVQGVCLQASASREFARANPFKWHRGDAFYFRHGRAVLQPLSQHLYGFCFAAGQNLNAAVEAVDCMTTEPQLISLPPCGFPEPDALDTPFNPEFPTFSHLDYTSNQPG